MYLILFLIGVSRVTSQLQECGWATMHVFFTEAECNLVRGAYETEDYGVILSTIKGGTTNRGNNMPPDEWLTENDSPPCQGLCGVAGRNGWTSGLSDEQLNGENLCDALVLTSRVGITSDASDQFMSRSASDPSKRVPFYLDVNIGLIGSEVGTFVVRDGVIQAPSLRDWVDRNDGLRYTNNFLEFPNDQSESVSIVLFSVSEITHFRYYVYINDIDENFLDFSDPSTCYWKPDYQPHHISIAAEPLTGDSLAVYSGSVQLQISIGLPFDHSVLVPGRLFFRGKCVENENIGTLLASTTSTGARYALASAICSQGDQDFLPQYGDVTKAFATVLCCDDDNQCEYPGYTTTEFCRGRVTHNQARAICARTVTHPHLWTSNSEFDCSESVCWTPGARVWHNESKPRGSITLPSIPQYTDTNAVSQGDVKFSDPGFNNKPLSTESSHSGWSYMFTGQNNNVHNVEVNYGSFTGESKCDVLDLEVGYIDQNDMELFSRRSWRISNHQGYFFSLYVDVVTGQSLDSLTPYLQGFGGNREIKFYVAPTDIDSFVANTVPFFGVDSLGDRIPPLRERYGVIIKTFLKVTFEDICHIYIKKSNAKLFFEGAEQTTPSFRSLSPNVFYELEIHYINTAAHETDLQLSWSCESSTSARVAIPSWNLFTRKPLRTPLVVDKDEVYLNSGSATLKFNCAVAPTHDVTVSCVSNDESIFFSHCQLLFTPSNWLENKFLNVFSASSDTISHEITCSVASNDPFFNGHSISLSTHKIQETPSKKCSIAFDTMTFKSHGWTTERAERVYLVGAYRSYTMIHTKPDAPFTFIVQGRTSICDASGDVCNTGVMVQFGDEIFGVYKPVGGSNIKPMCINSVGNSNLDIKVVNHNYVLSTLSGISVEINKVYDSNGEQYLDVFITLPRYMDNFLDKGICVGSEYETVLSLEDFPQVSFGDVNNVPLRCSGSSAERAGTTIVKENSRTGPESSRPFTSVDLPAENFCGEFFQKTAIVMEKCGLYTIHHGTALMDLCGPRSRTCSSEAIQQSWSSTMYNIIKQNLKNVGSPWDAVFCTELVDNNPDFCNGYGTITEQGCVCDSGTFGPSCSLAVEEVQPECEAGACPTCNDRSVLLDCRTGQYWKCFKGYCMYSDNGRNWEGLPSRPGVTPYCLNAISWADVDKKTGRTLWGYTNVMEEIRSIDDGETWQRMTYNEDEKEMFEYSLSFNPDNRSPSIQGNSHATPGDAFVCYLSLRWWLTAEEVCVSGIQPLGTALKPVIFCSKWWCDCVDESLWGLRFGIQEEPMDDVSGIPDGVSGGNIFDIEVGNGGGVSGGNIFDIPVGNGGR